MCHPRRDSSEGTQKNGLVTSFPQPPYGIEHIKYADDVVFTVKTDTDIQQSDHTLCPEERIADMNAELGLTVIHLRSRLLTNRLCS